MIMYYLIFECMYLTVYQSSPVAFFVPLEFVGGTKSVTLRTVYTLFWKSLLFLSLTSLDLQAQRP